MRALCGSIITAGALIGLGLTAMGIGSRYSSYTFDKDGKIVWLKLSEIDTSLALILVVLLICVVIGMGIAFIGLMFHHYRRHHEHLAAHGHMDTLRAQERPRLPV
jgi:hypothetical protein